MAKSKNPTMAQFDKDKWEPSELTSPDGRKWTPSTPAEEKNLVAAHGYTKTGKPSGGGRTTPQTARSTDKAESKASN